MWNPFRRRSSIRATLALILQRLDNMGNKFDDLIAAFNDETNVIASRFDSLRAQLGNTATDAQLAELDAISARLKALGRDPSDPIPGRAIAPTAMPEAEPTTMPPSSSSSA